MAEIKIDTVKMRECGNDIMDLSMEIGEEFEAIFNRIIDMPNKTFEWTGSAADAFAMRTKFEKVQYMELKNCLYNYGKYLVDQANYMESNIMKIKDS